MNISDIMMRRVITLNPDDTVAKALNLMYDNNIHQIPAADRNSRYIGMVFAKQFLGVNALPNSKIKSYITNTPTLSRDDTIEKSARLILISGNRALPVVENGRLTSIVSETDIMLTSDFGHAVVDQVMSGAIVIEEDSILGNALSKMRRYNISRLPIINRTGLLIGTINALDIAKIVSTPRERAGKSPGIGTMATVRNVKVRDIMRRAIPIERGTRINNVLEHFRRNEEIVIVGDRRPIGVVTPKDLLELILPKKTDPAVHISHIGDEEVRREIESQIKKFLRKIQGKLENIQAVVVYADKHKTRKYSIRARLIADKEIIDAKAVGFDPISACKELISRLRRRVKSEHSQKVRNRQQRNSARRIPS